MTTLTMGCMGHIVLIVSPIKSKDIFPLPKKHAPKGKGGAVPDRIYPGDGPTSLRECLRMVPLAQLRPLHGAGLPAKRLPDGSQEVSRGKETVADDFADEANMGRSTFRGPTEGRPKIQTARGDTKRLGIRGDVETRRQESLCAPGPMEGAGV